MTNVFTRLKAACSQISESAKWVEIDPVQVMQYPERLLLPINGMRHSGEHHMLGRGHDTLAYFLLLDTINFGSGYFPLLALDKDQSGYLFFAHKLKDFVNKRGLPKPTELASFRAEQCHEIFAQPTDNPHAAELMDLFCQSLNQLGQWLLARYNGDYLGFLRQSDSVNSAVLQLIDMPNFRDISVYGTHQVPFLKRAQILIHDMKIAEPADKLLDFEDFDDLTMFADNLIPFVLREDGAIKYDAWLADRIDRGELIAHGSPEEIEIRACSIQVGEMIKTVISEEGRNISSREIDYCIWNRGQQLKAIGRHPRHLTRTICY